MTNMSEDEVDEITTLGARSMDRDFSSTKLRMPRSHDLNFTCQRLVEDVCNDEEVKKVKLEVVQKSVHESVNMAEDIHSENICGDCHKLVENESSTLRTNEDAFIKPPDQISKDENCKITEPLNYTQTPDDIQSDCTQISSSGSHEDVYQKYDKKEIIGRGKFGKVFKIEHTKNNTFAAAKEIPYRSNEVRHYIYNEIDILKSLAGGEYIVQLYEVIDSNLTKPRKIIIITEYLDGGDLFDQIAKEDLLTETQVIDIMIQILEGVNFIHDRSILHRDLKPENIIYCSKEIKKIKIIDFGFAVKFDKTNPPKSMVGTTIFVAPEVLRYECQSYQTDIWSLGVIAYNLLAGITPFEIPRSGDLDRQLTDAEIIENIERCVFDFDDEGFLGISDNAKNFISSILVRDPERRLLMVQCRAHAWLTTLHENGDNNSSCSVSIQRIKNYMALKKWEKIGIAIQSVNYFKASIAHE